MFSIDACLRFFSFFVPFLNNFEMNHDQANCPGLGCIWIRNAGLIYRPLIEGLDVPISWFASLIFLHKAHFFTVNYLYPFAILGNMHSSGKLKPSSSATSGDLEKRKDESNSAAPKDKSVATTFFNVDWLLAILSTFGCTKNMPGKFFLLKWSVTLQYSSLYTLIQQFFYAIYLQKIFLCVFFGKIPVTAISQWNEIETEFWFQSNAFSRR